MKTKTFLTIAAGLLLAIPALLSQQRDTPERQKSQSQAGGMMSMDKMMAECRKHCQATMSSAERMQKMLEEARQSNDPAKMRAALEQAQKPLAEMQNHMEMCMNMMNMMGMQGQSGQKSKKSTDKR